MSFSKKVNNTPVNSISGEQWDTWNEMLWDSIDVEPSVGKNGRLTKEVTEIGVLNFIMEIGSQPNQYVRMKSNKALPEEGEEYSEEELAEMKLRPLNDFYWDTEYRDGKQIPIRKVKWPVDPEEQLVLAVDFPTIKLDYSQHPAADGVGEVKPLRIDYNGRGKGDYRDNFQRTVSNEVNWKSGTFGDRDVKYKITQACGNLEEYKSDQHDLAHLVQATCYWTIRATKNENNGRTYYEMSIKDPEKIQEIKTRRDIYTVEDQLEDAKCDVAFCGLLLNGGDYPEENLRQVRDFWWEKAKQSTQFDKNAGKEGKEPWMKGIGWEGSDLQKAYDALKGEKSEKKAAPVKQPKPESKSVKVDEPIVDSSKPDMDFDDD